MSGWLGRLLLSVVIVTVPNPNPNPTTKQHAIVNIQLNIVTCPTYPEKFIRDNVVAPFVPTSIAIIVTQRNFCWPIPIFGFVATTI